MLARLISAPHCEPRIALSHLSPLSIAGAGDTIDSNLDAANILKLALARGEITCIGATTFEEYRKAIARDPALDRRFRTIDIKEQNTTESLVVGAM